MDSSPCFLSIAEAGRLFKSRELSPVELTETFLSRIERVDSRIHSFISVCRAEALPQARAAEKEIMAGQYRGPIHGIPIGLKDLIETSGIRTTAHSRVLMSYIPA
jgi:aspartyl-tRNA(Asn)/glutamyl-tRNA(Gln) amidotransferase subunit A